MSDSRFIGNGFSVPDRDGLRVNEGGDGDLRLTLVRTRAERNAGDLRVDMTGVEASWNREEAIDLEEDDDFDGGGDVVSEKEAGNLTVTRSNIISTHNVGSGVFVRESSGGNAVVHIESVVSTDNKAGALDPFSLGHGIEILESGGGNLTGSVTKATVSSNAGHGVFADASGTATVADVSGGGNGLGLIGGIATVAVVSFERASASRGIAVVPTEKPSTGMTAIPRLRRFAPPLGMT